MRRLALVLVVVAAGLMATAARSGDGKGKGPTPKELVGVYKITAGEHGGKPIPEAELKADRVTITEDAITLVDKSNNKVYAATYKLDGGKLHMVSIEPKKGETADGLIKKEGDTVTLIYALPGGKAPTEFKTHAMQQMFTLKKTAK
jgi:uncharacterized protein (TIGR03067 family)